MVKEDLKALRINDILDKFPYEPQMDEVFGATADNIEDWADLCEKRIREIQILAEQQISERKAATTNGFEKRSYPKYNGEKFTY